MNKFRRNNRNIKKKNELFKNLFKLKEEAIVSSMDNKCQKNMQKQRERRLLFIDNITEILHTLKRQKSSNSKMNHFP